MKVVRVKLKICEGCGLSKPLWSKGRCKSCSTFKPLVAKKGITKRYKKKAPGESYSDFYRSQIELHAEHPYSLATGAYIATVGTVNIAHIFPKEKFKSVSRNPRNIILLTWEEHTRFDHLLNQLDFNKLEIEFNSIWEIVCNRVIELLPLLTETSRLSREFKKHVDVH